MRVLICPDKFAGTLSAVEVAEAVAAGWASAAPGDELVRRPLADGGPGFLDVVAAAIGGARIAVPTVDPLGRPVRGEVLVAGATAYVETAQACGLHLLAPAERDPQDHHVVRPRRAAHGRDRGGGTGGRGRARWLRHQRRRRGHARCPGHAGPRRGWLCPSPYGGAALVAARLQGPLPDVELVAATDVDSPLIGRHGRPVYGPQKGATRADVLLLDDALARFAEVLETLPTCPAGLASCAGAGAAGGLGAALLALGGRVVSGIGLVRELTGLDRALDETDLVITGEGSFDAQSLRGKVVAGVAAGAQDRGLPCLVLAGQARSGRREAATAGVTDTYTLVGHFGNVADALARPAEGLFALARRLAGQWSRYIMSDTEGGVGDLAWDHWECRMGPLALVPTLLTRRARGAATVTISVNPSIAPAEQAQQTAVALTDFAAQKVRALLEQEGRDDLRLRVAVQPGGCSGPALPALLRRALARRRRRHRLRRCRGRRRPDERPLPRRRDDRLRRHHREAGLHHRQPQRRRSSCACGDSFH